MDKVYCKRCGKYSNEDDFYQYKRLNNKVRLQHKRKLCRKKNKKGLLWEDYLNPKTISESSNWYKKNKEKINAYNRMCNKARIDSCADVYIKQLLKDVGFTNEQLKQYPEITQTKKEIVKINRQIKTSKL
jgi:hypothetical protein